MEKTDKITECNILENLRVVEKRNETLSVMLGNGRLQSPLLRNDVFEMVTCKIIFEK